jgi:hypothetical protein
MSNPNTMSRERFLLALDRTEDELDLQMLLQGFRDDDDDQWLDNGDDD